MKYLNILLCTLPLFVGVCSSCKDSGRERIAHLVTEWQGKEIQLPTNGVFTIQGRDTVQFPIEASYKILAYVDSTGCTSCRLQLHKWKELMEEIDSVSNKSVQFLFYLTPKSVRDARYITRRDDFTHPLCIDVNNEIDRMNHFPKEEMFHTFLLDADNKVKVIGNPIHNKAVRSLYLETITDSKVAQIKRPGV